MAIKMEYQIADNQEVLNSSSQSDTPDSRMGHHAHAGGPGVPFTLRSKVTSTSSVQVLAQDR